MIDSSFYVICKHSFKAQSNFISLKRIKAFFLLFLSSNVIHKTLRKAVQQQQHWIELLSMKSWSHWLHNIIVFEKRVLIYYRENHLHYLEIHLLYNVVNASFQISSSNKVDILSSLLNLQEKHQRRKQYSVNSWKLLILELNSISKWQLLSTTFKWQHFKQWCKKYFRPIIITRKEKWRKLRW